MERVFCSTRRNRHTWWRTCHGWLGVWAPWPRTSSSLYSSTCTVYRRIQPWMKLLYDSRWKGETVQFCILNLIYLARGLSGGYVLERAFSWDFVTGLFWSPVGYSRSGRGLNVWSAGYYRTENIAYVWLCSRRWNGAVRNDWSSCCASDSDILIKSSQPMDRERRFVFLGGPPSDTIDISSMKRRKHKNIPANWIQYIAGCVGKHKTSVDKISCTHILLVELRMPFESHPRSRLGDLRTGSTCNMYKMRWLGVPQAIVILTWRGTTVTPLLTRCR